MSNPFVERVALWRLAIGRAVMHLGLRIMPRGRVRSELYSLLDRWATDVRKTIAHASLKGGQ